MSDWPTVTMLRIAVASLRMNVISHCVVVVRPLYCCQLSLVYCCVAFADGYISLRLCYIALCGCRFASRKGHMKFFFGVYRISPRQCLLNHAQRQSLWRQCRPCDCFDTIVLPADNIPNVIDKYSNGSAQFSNPIAQNFYASDSLC